MGNRLLRSGPLAHGVLVVASLVIVAPACGDDDGQDTYSAERFPAAYAQALCGSLEHCCRENTVSLSFEQCTQGWKAYVERLLSAPSALTNYEPRKAKACVDDIRAAANATCAPVEGSISAARDVCSLIFIGKKPLGSPCGSAIECAPAKSGKRVGCEAPAGSQNDAGVLPLHVPLDDIALSTPVCVELGTATLGSPCLPGTTDARGSCDQNFFCEPKAQVCQPLGAVGASCVTGSCAPGGVCATTGPNVGRCVATSPLDGPCTTLDECDATSRCDVTAQKCVAKKLAGEACSNDAECAIGTCDDVTRKCLKNSIATSNTCNGRTE